VVVGIGNRGAIVSFVSEMKSMNGLMAHLNLEAENSRLSPRLSQKKMRRHCPKFKELPTRSTPAIWPPKHLVTLQTSGFRVFCNRTRTWHARGLEWMNSEISRAMHLNHDEN